MESLILILAAASVYTLPTIAAMARGSKRTGGIVIVNLFLGWTLLGWVIALAWAMGSDKAGDH